MSVLLAFGGKWPLFRGKQMFQLHSSILSGIFVSWFSNPFNWNLRKRQCISAVLLSGKKNFFNFFNWKRWAPFTFECYQTFRKFRNANKRYKNLIGNLQKALEIVEYCRNEKCGLPAEKSRNSVRKIKWYRSSQWDIFGNFIFRAGGRKRFNALRTIWKLTS